MTEVWEVSANDTPSRGHSVNAYGICRDETWTIRKYKSFKTAEEAADFIRTRTRCNPEFVRRAELMDGNEKDEYLTEFIDNPRYCHLRRFFIGMPPVQKMRENLLADGVKVI